MGAKQVQASAEMIMGNCLFVNCRRGLAFLVWNDYDNVIDGCEFRGCGTGIYGKSGSNYTVRNCHFEGSKEQDIFHNQPEHPCHIRR